MMVSTGKESTKPGERNETSNEKKSTATTAAVRIVVMKKKQKKKLRQNHHLRGSSKRNNGTQLVGRNNLKGKTPILSIDHSKRQSCGLPSFQHRHDTQNQTTSVNENDLDYDDGPDEDDGDIPSDVLVALHSIIQSDQGLSIPITNTTIQAVLEHQLFLTFDENHASTIQQEIVDLIQSNKIRQLYCQDTNSGSNNRAFLLTNDYIRGIWDVYHNSTNNSINTSVVNDQQQQQTIITWFVNNLQHWVGRTVSKSTLEVCWEEYRNDSGNESTTVSQSFEHVLKYLMDMQLLIRETNQTTTLTSGVESSYYLWLPQWGLTLKGWNEARRQLLNVLARSKEMSQMNLLSQNRHSCISTHFILKELVHQGRVEIVERPFGSFVRLVKDKT